MHNTYFVVCPRCGANLDPGERCDCTDTREEAPENDHAKG